MRILLASPLDDKAVHHLSTSHDVVCSFSPKPSLLIDLIRDRDVLVFRSGVSLTRDVLEAAPELKLVVRAGCGLDNIDMGYIEEQGIALVRVPQPASRAVAEMTFALMLALARNVREADALLRQGHWAKEELESYLLHGKVLGIIGAGNIGTRVGELGRAFGMRPIGCVEYPDVNISGQLHRSGIELKDFDEVVATADFVTVHVPLQASTQGLISADVIARMKPGVYLLNLARGGVLDEAALHRALVEGRLRGAALDVHEDEGEGKISCLAALPNVLLTPHIGSSTVDTQREIGERVIEIIESFAASRSEPAASQVAA